MSKEIRHSDLEKMRLHLLERIKTGVEFCADVYEKGDVCKSKSQRFNCPACGISRVTPFCKARSTLWELEAKYRKVLSRIDEVQR